MGERPPGEVGLGGLAPRHSLPFASYPVRLGSCWNGPQRLGAGPTVLAGLVLALCFIFGLRNVFFHY